MRDVRSLDVWQKAMGLCVEVYGTTSDFPASEQRGLTSQMRRCAVSIPSNLAEGYGRGTRKDYRQFVLIARGSAFELETQATLAKRLGFLSSEGSDGLLSSVREINRMLNGLVDAFQK